MIRVLALAAVFAPSLALADPPPPEHEREVAHALALQPDQMRGYAAEALGEVARTVDVVQARHDASDDIELRRCLRATLLSLGSVRAGLEASHQRLGFALADADQTASRTAILAVARSLELARIQADRAESCVQHHTIVVPVVQPLLGSRDDDLARPEPFEEPPAPPEVSPYL